MPPSYDAGGSRSSLYYARLSRSRAGSVTVSDNRRSGPGLPATGIRGRHATPGRSRHGVPDKQGREVLEEPIVKVSYDSRTDIVTVVLRDGVPVAESDEDKPGVILDYDERGNLVAVEILDASQRVTDARRVEFQMTE